MTYFHGQLLVLVSARVTDLVVQSIVFFKYVGHKPRLLPRRRNIVPNGFMKWVVYFQQLFCRFVHACLLRKSYRLCQKASRLCWFPTAWLSQSLVGRIAFAVSHHDSTYIGGRILSSTPRTRLFLWFHPRIDRPTI